MTIKRLVLGGLATLMLLAAGAIPVTASASTAQSPAPAARPCWWEPVPPPNCPEPDWP
jgi:hypothetical protein